MQQLIFRRHFIRSWFAMIAGTFFCLFISILPLLVFFDDEPFEIKQLLIIPVSAFLLYGAWQCIYLYTKNSRTVRIDHTGISVGDIYCKWEDLTWSQLNAKRSFGFTRVSSSPSVSNYVPVAVLGFSSGQDLCIYYSMYSGKKKLRSELEKIISQFPPRKTEEQVVAGKRSESSVTCRRCLGKGYVSNDDIKRLHKQRVWEPGECLLCKGTGVVQE